MVRLLAASALALLFASPAAAMVGGAAPAQPAIARHIVLITGTRGLCTGVAIAPDLVLTAAHCVVRSANFRLTASDRRRFTAKDVAGVTPHPQYLSGSDGPDLALVRLAALPPAILPPAPLSDRRAPISAGERFLVAGFGITAPRDRKIPATPLAAELIATERPSSQRVSLVDPETLGEAAGLGACNGDSGGPVFEQRSGELALVGIVSWSRATDGEPGCGYITGVIPLPRYRYWIVETAAKMGASLAP